jgi:hypothetical protein
MKEAIEDAHREMNENREQGRVLQSATEAQKWKPALMERAKATAADFDIIIKCSARGPFRDLEKTLAEKEEYLRLVQRKRRNAEEKCGKLLEHEKSIDAQIERLENLLVSTKL